MNRKNFALGCITLWMITACVAQADVSDGSFAYQGQLKLVGVPVTDTCDFLFTLWRDSVSPLPADQIGPVLTFDGLSGNPAPIDVVGGLFAVTLDFGATAFTDEARWLEVDVRCPAGAGTYTTLAPREPITATPRSVHTRGLAVDGRGQVAIGKDQPNEMLDVAGNISLRVEGFDPYVELTSDDASDSLSMRLKSLDGVGFAVTDVRDTPRMVVTERGHVGVGTAIPGTLLHVSGRANLAGNHIAFFENTAGPSADGILIKLNNPSTNRLNNFVTFVNGNDQVTGRIEGFDAEFGDWVIPPPIPNIGVTLDPAISYNPNWLNPGSLPTASFSRGQLPSLTFGPGTLPTVSFSRGSLPTATFSRGSLPSLSFNDGSLPSLSATNCNVLGVRVLCGFSWSAGSTPSATLSGGSLPSLTFNRGSLPSLSFRGGSLPSATFNKGALPSLTFSGGSLPSINSPPIVFGEPSLVFDLPTREELEALFCWAEETGNSDFLQLDPVAIAMTAIKQEVAKRCKDEGVTYGSKGADYAEWLPKLNPTDRFQIGQIVGVHGGKVSLKTEGAEQIMAISRAPVVVGNVPQKEDEHNHVTVGFMGQLPVVVRGKVEAGDYVIPSGLEDGTAVAVTPENLELRHVGRTLGRAWSDSDDEIYSLVNVAIGLNGNEEKIILEKQRDRMDAQSHRQFALAAENIELKSELASLKVELRNVLASVQRLEDQSRECGRVVTVADVSGQVSHEGASR